MDINADPFNWQFLMPNRLLKSKPDTFNEEVKKDEDSVLKEHRADHQDRIHNERLSSKRDLASALNIPHHFDLKLKAVIDVLDQVNPNPAFSLKQNSFILAFLNGLEKPLLELKASLGEDPNKHLAFNLIEKNIKDRLREELTSLRTSHYLNNTFSSSLAINDNLERDFSLDKSFKEINDKLLKFGLEDLVAENILRRVDKAGIDEHSSEALNSFKLHKDDFINGKREDKRIFNNPFVDKEYETLLETIYSKDIQASKFLGHNTEQINKYIDFSEKLLRLAAKSLSDEELYEKRVKNKIIDKLDQISFKVDLDLKDFKKLVNIIDENRSHSNKELPSSDDYFRDKLNQIFKGRFTEENLTKLTLNTDHFSALIHEYPEFKKDAEKLLVKSLQSIQGTNNFIGVIKTIADLKIPLNIKDKALIEEFISDNHESLIKLNDSKNQLSTSLLENFILGMRAIYDKDFNLENLNNAESKPIMAAFKTIKENSLEENKDTNIIQSLSKEDKDNKSTPLSRLEKNAIGEREKFLKIIKSFFSKISSASEFQNNIKQLENLVTYNPKINKELKREVLNTAFEAYLSVTNRTGELDNTELEKQKESMLRSII